ncbi:MAG: hypothetical protein KAU21_06730, partial [Gammaproteobacteria bacterium]|nr:hypothetical protein [Gammaproteobacteria bacterium]
AEIAESKPQSLSVQQVLLAVLKNISFPDKYSSAVKRIKKKIEYAKEDRDPLELIDNLASLLSEIVEESEETTSTGKEKKGLFSGLFGKADKASEVEEPAVSADKTESASVRIEVKAADTRSGISDVDEAMVLVRDVLTDYLRQLQMPKNKAVNLDKLRKRVQAINARGELKQLAFDMAQLTKSVISEQGQEGDAETQEDEHSFEVNEILIQLLERMDLPVELNERVDVLKLKWQGGVADDQIVDALEDIAELVIEIRTRIDREKNEIQLFLQQITDRLLELDKHIQEDTELTASIFEENKTFGEDVDGQVKNIRSDVQDATDLAKLKLSIYEKLEVISDHVENFRGKEEQRKVAMQA